MNLHEQGMLVRVPIKMRGLTAKSDTLTNEAADSRDGNRDSFSAGVKKFSVEALAPIVRIVNMARAFHVENTLPWADTGFRLIPVTRLPYWQRELTRMQGEFMDTCGVLFDSYPKLRRDYAKAVSSQIAQELPFPTLEQLRNNFDFDLMMQPIANVDDLRLKHIDPKTVAEIKAKTAQDMTEILDAGHKDIINRLFKVVTKIHEQTSKENGRLFESLVTNIQEAVDVLPALNLRNDPEINRLIKRVKVELSAVDVVALRINPKMTAKELRAVELQREATAKVAKDIIRDISGYGKPTAKAVKKVVPATTRTSAFANIDI